VTAFALSALTIRPLRGDDADMIAASFAAQGWNKPAAQYGRYYAEQCTGEREVLIAELDGAFAGYVTIVWQSDYQPFREQAIPEIVDLNVLIAFRRLGVASALLDNAETMIATHSPVAGLGVGMTADYGAAQILYMRRGYLPDGRGLASCGKTLHYGDVAILDDNLALYLTKGVGTS
jgi:ribosomal protein S18 acetylase RimI-like enzyme